MNSASTSARAKSSRNGPGRSGAWTTKSLTPAVNHAGEALKSLAKLRAALQTLPFFGSGKVVWLRDCNFLGEERAAAAQAVTENLAGLSQELKAFVWQNVRLLISAGKVDKRKSFYKTLEKIGSVETFAGWSADDGLVRTRRKPGPCAPCAT